MTLTLGKGVAPSLVHLVLGIQMLDSGYAAAAKKHLEIARQKNDHVPPLLANLATSLAEQEQPDLDRAIRLAEIACQRTDDSGIHLTRAGILAEIKKSEEAATDL